MEEAFEGGEDGIVLRVVSKVEFLADEGGHLHFSRQCQQMGVEVALFRGREGVVVVVGDGKGGSAEGAEGLLLEGVEIVENLEVAGGDMAFEDAREVVFKVL